MSEMMDKVERLTRRRARVATVMGIVFIATQAFRVVDDQLTRTVDYVQVIAWAVWALMLLLFILFGGGLWRSAEVRALLNDENTAANRYSALVLGFWLMIAGAALVYAITFYEPVKAREALHLVLTIGVGGALLRFGMLERRALKA